MAFQSGTTAPYPYAFPPQAPAAPAFAGFWRRTAAYVIDGILVFIATKSVDAVLGAALPAALVYLVTLVLSAGYYVYLWAGRGQTLGYQAMGIRLVCAEGGPIGAGKALLRYLVLAAFSLLFWLGMTLLALDLLVAVLPADSSWVYQYHSAFGIAALGFGAMLLLGLLNFLWVAFDFRKQAWHDKAAGTLVVRA